MRNRKPLFFMFLGFFLILSALGLTVRNIHQDTRAGRRAQKALASMEEKQKEMREEAVFYPKEEMPVVEADGRKYIGTLTIPKLNLELPVQDSLDASRLLETPCRYQGTLSQGNLIVAAHNYQHHFGKLHTLEPGDEIQFQTLDGELFLYEVKELETLPGDALEELTQGDWDLTLFTCTYGGEQRVTVRCNKPTQRNTHLPG